MLTKITTSPIKTRSGTMRFQATEKPEAKGKAHNHDLGQKELKGPSTWCHSLAPCPGAWGGREYAKTWGWKPSQAWALPVDFFDLCYSRKAQRGLPCSLSQPQGPPGVGLTCVIRPAAAENLGSHCS